ncbi:hypothetical protein AAFF_G00286540 [Aldrovandia affinis]|uniref:BHLH domain-containing protein n=1 Tax=Aldrovandia affinis TaxID=143900 RepID=A0AAD7TB65_9TELE|nr:hypothetical protein AAFF_G00286540 [Aldrovandia affinis]
MDISAPFLSYSGTQHPWNGHSSDSEFYSLSPPDTPSPAYSMDLSLSPCPQTWAPGPGFGKGGQITPPGASRASVSPSSGEEGASSCRGKSRGRRVKNPSKQRQSASEKEKLRMRDLTKALHHLRTYLPPSVAPAGQTLTKIETLRLAIRYIAHLSAQLGLSEQTLSLRKELNASRDQIRDQAGFCQYGSVPGFWGQGQGQNAERHQCAPSLVCPSQNPSMDRSRFTATLEVSLQDKLLNSSLDSLLQSPPSDQMTQAHQMYSKDLSCQIVPQEFWV